MVQQMMLKIIRSEKANQIVLVTGPKQNKWRLGKLEKKKKKKMHSPHSVSNP
jgi:5'-3' exonuclease